MAKDISSIARLRNVVKLFQGASSRVPVRALDGINLELREGDFAIIAAPSGSGKTTLLNLLGARDQPTAGTVEIAGEDIGAMSIDELTSFRLARIGRIAEGGNMVQVLSAEENVEFPLRLQGVTRHERRKRVADALGAVGLSHRAARRRPNELSPADQQRVAIARAVVGQPNLVVADEPTAQLDSVNGLQIIDLMSEVNGQTGIAFVIATHDPLVTERARRVVRMRDGRIVSDEVRSTT